MAEGIVRLRAATGREVLPENPPGAVYLGDLHLLDFFARVAERGDTGLLLDCAHLAIFQREGGRGHALPAAELSAHAVGTQRRAAEDLDDAAHDIDHPHLGHCRPGVKGGLRAPEMPGVEGLGETGQNQASAGKRNHSSTNTTTAPTPRTATFLTHRLIIAS